MKKQNQKAEKLPQGPRASKSLSQIPTKSTDHDAGALTTTPSVQPQVLQSKMAQTWLNDALEPILGSLKNF